MRMRTWWVTCVASWTERTRSCLLLGELIRTSTEPPPTCKKYNKINRFKYSRRATINPFGCPGGGLCVKVSYVHSKPKLYQLPCVSLANANRSDRDMSHCNKGFCMLANMNWGLIYNTWWRPSTNNGTHPLQKYNTERIRVIHRIGDEAHAHLPPTTYRHASILIHSLQVRARQTEG